MIAVICNNDGIPADPHIPLVVAEANLHRGLLTFGVLNLKLHLPGRVVRI